MKRVADQSFLTCRVCGVRKPNEEFPWVNQAKGYKRRVCKPCFAGRAKASREKRLDHYKAVDRAYHQSDKGRRNAVRRASYDPRRDRENRLIRQYGITLGEYEALSESQGGVCAICGKPESAANQHGPLPLAVDHCHGSGAVRGLLCSGCNTGLGKFQDDPELLRAALRYLGV